MELLLVWLGHERSTALYAVLYIGYYLRRQTTLPMLPNMTADVRPLLHRYTGSSTGDGKQALRFRTHWLPSGLMRHGSTLYSCIHCSTLRT